MASIVVNGLPTSQKTPGMYLSVVLGGGSASTGITEQKLLLMGNRIETAVSGSTPTVAVAAGTAVLATVVPIRSEDDAITLFGRGSELHLGCKRVIEHDPRVTLYACPFGEASGAAAAAQTITIANASAISRSVTIRVSCCGFVNEAVIQSGTTTTNIGLAIAQAINDLIDCPVTAQSAFSTPTATVTITAKNKGTRGNNIKIKVDVIDGATITKLRTGALAVTIGTTVFTLTAEKLAAGSGTETTTFATAVTNITAERYHRIAASVVDATNCGVLDTMLLTNQAATVMRWEQAAVCILEDSDTATIGAKAIAAGLNDPRFQVGWHFNSDFTSMECAAQMMCARLAGDVNIGGSSIGEVARASANLDLTTLASILVQENVADRPLPTEIESALNYGVTPLVGSSLRPGKVAIARSITSRFKDTSGGLNYGVIDTSDVTATDYTADRILGLISTTYANYNLDSDSADGSAPKVSLTVQPRMLRSTVRSELKTLELEGIIVDVDLLDSKLRIERDVTVRTRVNGEIPCAPSPSFHTFGGNLRQLATTGI